jgi:hypothetical protein
LRQSDFQTAEAWDEIFFGLIKLIWKMPDLSLTQFDAMSANDRYLFNVTISSSSMVISFHCSFHSKSDLHLASRRLLKHCHLINAKYKTDIASNQVELRSDTFWIDSINPKNILSQASTVWKSDCLDNIPFDSWLDFRLKYSNS